MTWEGGVVRGSVSGFMGLVLPGVRHEASARAAEKCENSKNSRFCASLNEVHNASTWKEIRQRTDESKTSHLVSQQKNRFLTEVSFTLSLILCKSDGENGASGLGTTLLLHLKFARTLFVGSERATLESRKQRFSQKVPFSGFSDCKLKGRISSLDTADPANLLSKLGGRPILTTIHAKIDIPMHTVKPKRCFELSNSNVRAIFRTLSVRHPQDILQ
jgi:hypothetical protein